MAFKGQQLNLNGNTILTRIRSYFHTVMTFVLVIIFVGLLLLLFFILDSFTWQVSSVNVFVGA